MADSPTHFQLRTVGLKVIASILRKMQPSHCNSDFSAAAVLSSMHGCPRVPEQASDMHERGRSICRTRFENPSMRRLLAQPPKHKNFQPSSSQLRGQPPQRPSGLVPNNFAPLSVTLTTTNKSPAHNSQTCPSQVEAKGQRTTCTSCKCFVCPEGPTTAKESSVE